MYFSDEVKLRSVVVTQGANGYPIETATDTAVNANVKSLTRSEFYASQAAGIDAVFEVEIHVEDWSQQPMLLIGTVVYDIVRAYQKGLGIVSLTISNRAT